ncbi:putative virion structural protein [Pseudomonas phage OBP]|uniref:putative virion structural protein n=1 Tax=Pseudomonas phage OBP TaxID=1124849 RepID=UPI000240D5F2|nr:putative virion structural protein [Pseudomonas phage OBP]AEV89702.1 putative virion structural protein [Pseudomonas phage OBP]
MSITFDLDAIVGAEALTVGERLTSFFKELSLGIDSFNAKNFNKTIHTVKGEEVWKQLTARNVYFDVSIKHIPSPVFFNADKMSFKEYVDFVLKAVPLVKLAQSQTDAVYRGIKSIAATGKVPYSIRNVDAMIMVNETKQQAKLVFEDTKVYTRALNQMYPNFGTALEVDQNFNRVVETLKSRDIEVLSKSADQVVYVVNLLKKKIDSGDMVLDDSASRLLNDTISELVETITFAGMMVAQLSELTRILQLQIDEAKKL